MITSVAYFPDQCARNSGPAMEAVLDCLQGCGITTCEGSWHSDAALIWSVLWHGRMAANQQVYQHYRSQNKPVIIVEIGSLYRGHTWKVAVNNITAQGYYGHLDSLDWDRPKKLGISVATNINPRPEIVIALQHSKSQQVADIEMSQWLNQWIKTLQQHTDRPLRVRPHPRNKINLNCVPPGVTIEQPRPLPNTYDSFDMHFNCHAVVNHNSGIGIQAAIAGVRPLVDQSSLAWPVSVQIQQIEQDYNQDRDLWLTQVCHTEYTLEELRYGKWLKRISPALDS